MRHERTRTHIPKMLWLLAPILVAGCASTHNAANETLNDYLKAEGFAPYRPPNDRFYPLTILAFDKDGKDNLITLPSECGAPHEQEDENQPPKGWIAKTTIPLLTTTVTNGVDAEAKSVGDLVKKFNLDVLANVSLIRSISIDFKDPFLVVLSKKKAQDIIDASSSDCQEYAADPRNLIVSQVLGAASLEYTFKDANGANVKLTAEVLEKANVSANLKAQLDGKSTLSVPNRLYYGYKAFSKSLSPGAFVDTATLDDKNLDLSQIDKLRAEAMNQR